DLGTGAAGWELFDGELSVDCPSTSTYGQFTGPIFTADTTAGCTGLVSSSWRDPANEQLSGAFTIDAPLPEDGGSHTWTLPLTELPVSVVDGAGEPVTVAQVRTDNSWMGSETFPGPDGTEYTLQRWAAMHNE